MNSETPDHCLLTMPCEVILVPRSHFHTHELGTYLLCYLFHREQMCVLSVWEHEEKEKGNEIA